MSTTANHTGIIPAHIAFLAIYNPTIGGKGDSPRDEIVYFFDGSQAFGFEDGQASPDGGTNREKVDENMQLRSVGLAKGMLQFSQCDVLDILTKMAS